MAGPEDFIAEAFARRDYTTISCGPLTDPLAVVALENRAKIMAINLGIIRESLSILEEWVNLEELFHWVKPKAGTTAFVGYRFRHALRRVLH